MLCYENRANISMTEQKSMEMATPDNGDGFEFLVEADWRRQQGKNFLDQDYLVRYVIDMDCEQSGCRTALQMSSIWGITKRQSEHRKEAVIQCRYCAAHSKELHGYDPSRVVAGQQPDPLHITCTAGRVQHRGQTLGSSSILRRAEERPSGMGA